MGRLLCERCGCCRAVLTSAMLRDSRSACAQAASRHGLRGATVCLMSVKVELKGPQQLVGAPSPFASTNGIYWTCKQIIYIMHASRLYKEETGRKGFLFT